MAANAFDPSEYQVPADQPVTLLDCTEAFLGLTKEEKLYVHYFSQAAWEGSKICLFQTSPESPVIFGLILALYSEGVDELRAKCTKREDLTSEEFDAFLRYAATFLGNMGNYKSFGDTKFVPSVSKERVEKIIEIRGSPLVTTLWQDCKDRMYSLDPYELRLGFGEQGISTYYSADCFLEDAQFIQKFLEEQNMSAYNTRVSKHDPQLEGMSYCVHVASAEATEARLHMFEGVRVMVLFGDHSPILAKVTDHLTAAKQYGANDTQRQMLDKYIAHFQHGNVEDHKESQRLWIKDVGPSVETTIGFIESYRDPLSVRGEFEGMVAVVNRDMSRKFAKLVDAAEELLPKLPWGKEFEKDHFQRPDFTSLDVVSFASSGIPIGINLPNYDDVRQTQGFKNVSLNNVLASAFITQDRVTFLTADDQMLFHQYATKAFEVQVGLHELLGHGTGKLLQENEDGSLNFDKSRVINPFTDEPIRTYYRRGETWNSKFPVISTSYEECRAECVGIFLCLEQEVLSIFGHEGDEAEDVYYVNWLIMARAGLTALEFYDPVSGSWGQAHMQARFGILRILLNAGEDFVTITQIENDVTIELDREKIMSVGRPAIGDFLSRLHIYKCIGDYESAKALYDEVTSVPPQFSILRQIVLAQRKPRRVFVQPHTRINDAGDVELINFEASPQGLVESMLARFGDGTDVVDPVHSRFMY